MGNFKRQNEGKEKVGEVFSAGYSRMTALELRFEKYRNFYLEDVPCEFMDGKKRQRMKQVGEEDSNNRMKIDSLIDTSTTSSIVANHS